MQVFHAHVMVNAVVTALQQRPEALYAVRVGLLADIFTDAVVNRCVIISGHSTVAGVIVCVDG